MPALNFKREFADLVRSGAKRQTIRIARKTPIKPGDQLHLFTGMRTKSCERLRTVACIGVDDLTIGPDLVVGGRLLVAAARERFANADGFESWADMSRWFEETYGLPFHGVVIYWEGK